ncbi:hypothetical protein D3C72_2068860 [compost metagenome]
MVFDRALAAAGDEDHVADAGLIGFFHGVLDQRLVHDGEHLLGGRLGGGQEAGAQASYRKNCFAYTGWSDHRCSVY